MKRHDAARGATLLTLMLAIPLGLVGCGGSHGGGGAGGSGGGGNSNTLTVATDKDIESLELNRSWDTWSTAIVHACTRRLVDYDAQGKLVGDIAEKWEIADGGKVYTFHLRPDAKFADGSQVQAENFKAELARLQDPDQSPSAHSFYTGIAGVDTPDAQTLTIHLNAPEPTFLNVMGMTFAAPLKERVNPKKFISSGPYTIDEYVPHAKVVLKRNQFDTRNTSKLERIVVQLQVNDALQLTRLQNGEVDLLPGIPPQAYARVMADPAAKQNVVQGVVNLTWYFGMNTSKPPFNNPKVRRAVLLALNRKQHAEFSGGGEAANGVLPPHVPGYDPQRKLPEQDVAGAKKLMAEAGFPNGLPAGTKPTFWFVQDDQYTRHAQAIQSDLAAVGINVELRPVTYSEYMTGYRTSADCWYGGWYPDFPDAGNFLEPVLHSKNIKQGRSPNAARYRNPKFDALLDKAHVMANGPQRDALYKQAEDILVEDAPWAPLFFEAETRYFRAGVTGVVVHPVWRQMLTGIDKKASGG